MNRFRSAKKRIALRKRIVCQQLAGRWRSPNPERSHTEGATPESTQFTYEPLGVAHVLHNDGLYNLMVVGAQCRLGLADLFHQEFVKVEIAKAGGGMIYPEV